MCLQLILHLEASILNELDAIRIDIIGALEDLKQ